MVNQRCYPYIKIRKNRFFATLKNIKIKTKKHPFYRGAFFINSNQYLLFLKLFFELSFLIFSYLYFSSFYYLYFLIYYYFYFFYIYFHLKYLSSYQQPFYF